MSTPLRRLLQALAVLAGCAGCAGSRPALAALILADSGSTRYTIYYALNAPASVALAAQELQTYLRKSTGVTFPIKRAEPLPGTCLCLGDSQLARKAGIISKDLPDDGYRILISGGSVFIAGTDTGDGVVTAQGGVSTGTLNGVYTFLEEDLGVRWLTPGEDGEYVPPHPVLSVEQIDRLDKPRFASRIVAYVGEDKTEVKTWLRRQKQGGALRLNHSHSWNYLVPAQLYDSHPEWFALIGGRRAAPAGDRYKLETTDQDLVRYVADQTILQLRGNPSQYAASISPTDGAQWSESPQSRSLYDHDPHGNVSLTPLILKFYNDVAERVGAELPDRLVCGYIYAQYVFPPSSIPPRVDPHLCLVIAPNFSYGYALYSKPYREDLARILTTWSKAAKTLGYYDLPTAWTNNVIKAPNAPGTDILKFLYPTIAASGVRAVYVYGSSSWGHGALTNYLIARLNWNPHANVESLMTEFCTLAYGKRSGGLVCAAYHKTDAAVAAFRSRHTAYLEQVNPELLAQVYTHLIPEWTNVYRASIGIDTRNISGEQQRRLALLTDDLRVFLDGMQSVLAR